MSPTQPISDEVIGQIVARVTQEVTARLAIELPPAGELPPAATPPPATQPISDEVIGQIVDRVTQEVKARLASELPPAATPPPATQLISEVIGHIVARVTQEVTARLAARPTQTSYVIVVCIPYLAGVVWVEGSAYILNRYIEDPQALRTVFSEEVLSIGVFLQFIFKGSINLLLRATDFESLKKLWQGYESGQLKENIEKVLVTEELTALANGQKIEFVVEISEEQYKKACLDLVAQHEGMADPDINAVPLTLGNLFKQDMKTANILPFYPTSSAVQNYPFLNDTKYLIHDIPKDGQKKNSSSLYLNAGRICSIAGNEFPILIDRQPSENLKAHWKEWLPQFPGPVFKTINEGLEDEDPVITIFPMQIILKEKHAVDPDTHYHILLKSAIPEMGAPCPKHYTQKDAIFPCMVKANQSLNGYGNFKVEKEKDLPDALKKVNEALGEATPALEKAGEAAPPLYVITEFVEDVEKTLGCQFYLNKKGEIEWLGANVNLLKADYDWIGSEVDWDQDEEHRDRVYDKFIMPVAKYLHEKGYFGFTGIDIITSPTGDYLVDVNARITGFTPHALIAPVMALDGLTKSLFKTRVESHDCTTEELIEKANSSNERKDGRIFILNSIDVDEGCIAAILVFGKTMEYVEERFDYLT